MISKALWFAYRAAMYAGSHEILYYGSNAKEILRKNIQIFTKLDLYDKETLNITGSPANQ